jgi:hypothetical protein
MIQEELDCPICYEKIDNDINMSISACGHKFHTNCLLLCGPACPMCRRNMLTNNKTTNNNTTRLLPGVYTHNEFKQLMQEQGILDNDLSHTTIEWLKDCEEYDNSMSELNEKRKEREENKKQTIKKANPDKYKLFYVNDKK